MENYEVLNEEFGQGSYGKVALVRHKQSGKEMVWKCTDFGGMVEKQKQQLITEVYILMELKHESIVRCYDKFVDKKSQCIYIVMELCSGGDLSQLIQRFRNANKSDNASPTKTDEGTELKTLEG
jgi:serine/threonine protein kinase